MAELLVELFSEEIPARMQRPAAKSFLASVLGRLEALGLTWDNVRTYTTPRRIAICIDKLPHDIPERTEEKRGPRVDAPEKAIEGFLRSAGLETLDDCERRETPKGAFLYAVTTTPGGPLRDVLPEVVLDSVRELVWPKSMRWGEGTFRWVRPLHSVLALFDGAPLEGELDLGDRTIPFGDRTEGHRFLSPGRFEVADFKSYETGLREAHVVLDAAEREALIHEQATALARKAKLALKDDPALLAEVAGLVEWPVVLIGTFEPEFLEVPQEVLIETMRGNQKYFALMDPDGKLSNRFVIVANMPDDRDHIVSGNERVLRARLSDARFFWQQDLKLTLDARLPRLKEITFHEKLGPVADRAARLKNLAENIAGTIGANPVQACRAAELCKADLVSDMVFEFPEVQGIMGRYYALAQGEPDEVAQAVAAHYAPAGPSDACPSAPVSVALALAEKLDTLAGFFAVDLKPTGSKDPYALRRAALGVIRLILENDLRVDLGALFDDAIAEYVGQNCAAVPAGGTARAKIRADLLAFFDDRLRVMLRDQGDRHDHVSAVLSVDTGGDLVRKIARLKALTAFLDGSDQAESLLTAYSRAANILKAEEKKDGKRYDGAVTPTALSAPDEKALYQALQDADAVIGPFLDKEDDAAALAAMAGLRAPLDAFFDNVTVNADDAAVRTNRLTLLAMIRRTMDRIADFSKIEG